MKFRARGSVYVFPNDRTGSGAAADTGAGLVPDAVVSRVQALILETEEVAATGRACQAFIRVNGMAGP